MRRKIECCECEKALKKDEVALCKKLLGRILGVYKK